MRSAHWATRLAHELRMHECSSFLTLTFAPENLPDDNGVHVRDVQLFIKRARKMLEPRGIKIRYFACGEYGDAGDRPHYHILLFGYDFPDRKPWRKTSTGHVTYRSAELEKLWPFGHSEIGTVTPESAAYVARYITKKINGDRAEDHYTRPHPLTGQLHRVQAEFLCMSTKPGIGLEWLEKNYGDTVTWDFSVVNGVKRPTPPYYKKKMTELEQLRITAERKRKARKHADNNTDRRLMVREESTILKLARLKREMESK